MERWFRSISARHRGASMPMRCRLRGRRAGCAASSISMRMLSPSCCASSRGSKSWKRSCRHCGPASRGSPDVRAPGAVGRTPRLIYVRSSSIRAEHHPHYAFVVFQLGELRDLEAVGGKDATPAAPANAAFVLARAHLRMLAAQRPHLGRELDRRLLPDALRVGYANV